MKLMEDPALVTLVANLVKQAVSETGPDSTFEGMAPVRGSSEFARMILDGLEILGVPQRGPAWEPEIEAARSEEVTDGAV